MASTLTTADLALLREAVQRRRPELLGLADEIAAAPRMLTHAERDDLREAAIDELVIEGFQDEDIVNGRGPRLEGLVDALDHLEVETRPSGPPVTRRGMFGRLLGDGIGRVDRARRGL